MNKINILFDRFAECRPQQPSIEILAIRISVLRQDLTLG